MSAINEIVQYAKSQIGVSEDPLGSNIQKYGALIDSTDWYLYKEGSRTWRHKVNGYDWCTQFVDASFITTFDIDNARKMLYRPTYNNYGAVVSHAYSYFKNAGRGYIKSEHDPHPGDVIYFQNSRGLSHTGLVIEATESTVTTIEGNSGKNNYYVALSTYGKTESKIYGYGCPNYDEVDPDPEEMDGYKVGNTYEVVCDNLMIRTGPDKSYDIIGDFKKGDRFVCRKLAHDAYLNTWLQSDHGWSCGLYEGKRYIDEPKKDGWIKTGGNWYYYKDGVMVKSDWILYKGNYYFLGSDGIMVTGWQNIGGVDYYFYPEGRKAVIEWRDGWFLNEKGKKTDSIGSWKHNSKGWWFINKDGWYPKSRHVLINGIDYNFDASGYMIEE